MDQKQKIAAADRVLWSRSKPSANEDDAFLQNVLRSGQRLTRNSFSKTTRDRQKFLLIAAVLTLAFAFSAIDIDIIKPGVLQAQVKVNNERLANIFAAATVYLLFLFGLGAFQESAADDFRHAYVAVELRPYIKEIEKSIDEKRDHLLRLEDEGMSGFRERAEIMEKIRKIEADYSKKREPLQVQQDRLRSQLFDFSGTASALSREEMSPSSEERMKLFHESSAIASSIMALYHQEDKELAPYQELYDELARKENFENIRQQQEAIGNTNWQNVRIQHLGGVLNRTRNLKRGRKVVEIYAPLLAGILAVIVSLWRMYLPKWPFWI